MPMHFVPLQNSILCSFLYLHSDIGSDKLSAGMLWRWVQRLIQWFLWASGRLNSLYILAIHRMRGLFSIWNIIGNLVYRIMVLNWLDLIWFDVVKSRTCKHLKHCNQLCSMFGSYRGTISSMLYHQGEMDTLKLMALIHKQKIVSTS